MAVEIWLFFVSMIITTFDMGTSDPLIDVRKAMEAGLERQDKAREEFLMRNISKYEKNFKFVQERFYQITSQPMALVSGCSIQKSLGGIWLPSCGSLDGAKTVCLDKIVESLDMGKCLVYSFGIANDWSFEDALADLGCEIRAFDPSIDAPAKRGSQISFYKLGISHKTEKMVFSDQLPPGTVITSSGETKDLDLLDFMTLEDILDMIGDNDKEITLLKLDVEGSEIKCLNNWSKNNVLNNVKQIVVEMHMNEKSKPSTFSSLIKSFQRLYKKGFKIMSYMPNTCQEKKLDLDDAKRFHTFFDLLLVKENQ